MLYADETVTCVHFDKANKQYICTVISGVSLYSAENRTVSDTNETSSRETTMRIPESNMPDDFTIKKGDFICLGKVSGIARRADIDQHERFVVNEIRNNCRGKHLRHWAVIGS